MSSMSLDPEDSPGHNKPTEEEDDKRSGGGLGGAAVVAGGLVALAGLYGYSCYRHQDSSLDTIDICEHLASLGEAKGKRVLLSWFRMAILSDEVYSGNPWATKRYAFLAAAFKDSGCQIQFTFPSSVRRITSSGEVPRNAEEQKKASLWMAVKGDSAVGGKLAEVIFRGTQDGNDAGPDLWLFAGWDGESTETTEVFANELVSFIKANNVTSLRVGGHSLGGLRASTVGLHTTVLAALHGETAKHDNSLSLFDVIKRQVRVTVFDPPGTTSFKHDGKENENLMEARRSVISIISNSTIVSRYTTEHISRPYVFHTNTSFLNLHSMVYLLIPIAECLMGKKEFTLDYPNRKSTYEPPGVPAGLSEEERGWWAAASRAWKSLDIPERVQERRNLITGT